MGSDNTSLEPVKLAAEASLSNALYALLDSAYADGLVECVEYVLIDVADRLRCGTYYAFYCAEDAVDWVWSSMRYHYWSAVLLGLVDGVYIAYNSVIKFSSMMLTSNYGRYQAVVHGLLTNPLNLVWLIPLILVFVFISLVAHCLDRVALQMELCPCTDQSQTMLQRIATQWPNSRRFLKFTKGVAKATRSFALLLMFLSEIVVNFLALLPMMFSLLFIGLALMNCAVYLWCRAERAKRLAPIRDYLRAFSRIDERAKLPGEIAELAESVKTLKREVQSHAELNVSMTQFGVLVRRLEQQQASLEEAKGRLRAIDAWRGNLDRAVGAAIREHEAVFTNLTTFDDEYESTISISSVLHAVFESLYRGLWPLLFLPLSPLVFTVVAYALPFFILANVAKSVYEQKLNRIAVERDRLLLKLAINQHLTQQQQDYARCLAGEDGWKSFITSVEQVRKSQKSFINCLRRYKRCFFDSEGNLLAHHSRYKLERKRAHHRRQIRRLQEERSDVLETLHQDYGPGWQSVLCATVTDGLTAYGLMAAGFFVLNMLCPFSGLSFASLLILFAVIVALVFTTLRAYQHYVNLCHQQQVFNRAIQTLRHNQVGTIADHFGCDRDTAKCMEVLTQLPKGVNRAWGMVDIFHSGWFATPMFCFLFMLGEYNQQYPAKPICWLPEKAKPDEAKQEGNTNAVTQEKGCWWWPFSIFGRPLSLPADGGWAAEVEVANSAP